MVRGAVATYVLLASVLSACTSLFFATLRPRGEFPDLNWPFWHLGIFLLSILLLASAASLIPIGRYPKAALLVALPGLVSYLWFHATLWSRKLLIEVIGASLGIGLILASGALGISMLSKKRALAFALSLALQFAWSIVGFLIWREGRVTLEGALERNPLGLIIISLATTVPLMASILLGGDEGPSA